MSFFPFHVGQRVHETRSPFRHGTVVRIFHPGPRATIWVRLDGLGIASFNTGGLAAGLPAGKGGHVHVARKVLSRVNPGSWSALTRAFVIVAVLFVALNGMTVATVAYQISESQHEWCQLLGTLTLPAPKGSPPLNSRSQEVLNELHDLQRSLGC